MNSIRMARMIQGDNWPDDIWYFNTTEELLNIQDVKNFSEVDDFSRYVMSKAGRLMAEYNIFGSKYIGEVHLTIGFIKDFKQIDDLPIIYY